MPHTGKRITLPPEKCDAIVRRYTTRADDGSWVGTSIIAREYHVSPQTVRNILVRAGITLRDAREAHAHGKRCKPIKNLPTGDAPPCKCGCGAVVAWNRRKNQWNVYVAGHYRAAAPYKSREWLYEQYVVQRRTAADIGRECGVLPRAVLYQMRLHDIPIRDRSESRKGRHIGSQNGFWKGGSTPERQRLYHSEEWKAVVREVYARDKYTCQRCGSPKRSARGLHAHHVKSWAEHPELRQEPSNLVTLCNVCHAWVHSLENVNREWIG